MICNARIAFLHRCFAFRGSTRASQPEGNRYLLLNIHAARHMAAPVIRFPRLHPGQPTGTFSSCLCLAGAVDPRRNPDISKKTGLGTSPFAASMTETAD